MLRILGGGVGGAIWQAGELWPAGGMARGDDEAQPPTSHGGFHVGDRVPNFYVRAITGPLQGKSVCYVCRNGDRPVAMVLCRRIVPRLETLLKGLDTVVDAHRAQGLRGFGVFMARDTKSLLGQVQTLAFNSKIALPMTIAAAPSEGPGLRGLSDEIAVSVVLYREQKVRATFHLTADELGDDSIANVLQAVRRLADDEASGEAAAVESSAGQ